MENVTVDSSRSWIIAGSCFFVDMIFGGIFRLAGVFFVETMSAFSVNREIASFPYTVSKAVKFACGPIVGYLGQQFGLYRTIFACTVLCVASLGACFFAKDVIFITVMYGFVFGFGAGFTMMLPVLINLHFSKQRALASGLRSLGNSFGSLILPPISVPLLEKYGISGTFLVLSGLAFNCLPAVMISKTMTFDSTSKSNEVSKNCSAAETQPLLSKLLPTYNTRKPDDCVTQLSSSKRRSGTLYIDNITIPGDINAFNKANCPEFHLNNKSSAESKTTSESNSHNPQFRGNPMTHSIPAEKSLNYGKDSLQKQSNSPDHCSHKEHLSSEDIIYTNTMDKILANHSKKKKKTSKTKKKTPCFKMWMNPIFLILVLTRSLFAVIVISLTTTIVDFSRDVGLPESSRAYSLSAFSVGEMSGFLVLGWIANKEYIQKRKLLSTCCFLEGLLFIAVAFSNGSVMLFSILCAVGFVHSAETFITPLLVADYISEEHQTMAMASTCFLAAPLSLFLSPLIGFLRDDMGSYEYLYYGVGLTSLACSLLITVIPCFRMKSSLR